MRRLIAAAVAAVMFSDACGIAQAFDPSTGQSWQRPARPAVVAYFRLPFHASRADDKVAYGLAITAPTPGIYGTEPLSIADTPKLLDLRFNEAVPDTMLVAGRLAWTRDPSKMPEGQHLDMFESITGLALSLAGTALTVYGAYWLLKKKCPALKTSNGACIKIGN